MPVKAPLAPHRRAPLPRAVWVLGLVSLLMDLSSEIYHALLPAFLTVTLGVSVAAMGAIDGVAEATASFARLLSGRWSDRSRRRKPWILLGYGLGAAAKPLFPLASGAWPVLGARFVDRLGKGIRGAPRDALVADATPPADRGRAYGLRQSLDSIGAFLAPLAAVGLMIACAGDIRLVFWIAAVPAVLSVLLIVVALDETARPVAPAPATGASGFRDIDSATRRLIAVGFLFALARFSEGFLILRAIDLGLAPAWSPLVLVLFNLFYLGGAYPAGSLSDRASPRLILGAGMLLLAAANLLLAGADTLLMLLAGVALWGLHMALTQGLFARMIADLAPPGLRATSFGAFHFATGIGALLASLGAGLLWDRSGPATAFAAAAAVAVVAAAMLSLLGPGARTAR